MNRSKLMEKEASDVRLQQPKSHEMGVQVSRRIHPEVSSQSALREGSRAPRIVAPRVGRPVGEQDSGGACAHAFTMSFN